MTSYGLHHTDRFDDCIRDFQQRDARYLAELMDVFSELVRKPFGNPKLQTHPMKGVTGEKRYITYVGGSKGRRLIWSLFNKSIVLLLFGEHDIEERAERLELIEDPGTGGLEIVERTAEAEPVATRPAESEQVGQLFMPWTDDELRGFGFEDHEVPVLRRLDDEAELLDLEMRDDAFELAYNLIAYHDPDGETARKVPEPERKAFEAQVQKVTDQRELERERQVASPRSRKHFAPLSPEGMAEILAKPIEDWMIFLHPEQAKLTQRPFSGPARVRGAAGTGKTVVALHRARHLAETYGGPILFTTYVTNLPPVYESLFARLAPEVADRVEFINLHKWAYRFVKQHGNPFNLDSGQIRSAYAEAWRRSIPGNGAVASAGLTRDYLREEINWVVKGRGLRTLPEYLGLSRTGRGTPLPEAVRREVWDLYQEYERQLQRRRTVDFNDLLLKALELVQNGRLPQTYAAVVIDEAQDLTEVGLRLAYEAAGGDGRDALFLVGDGQQSVYPGGFSLSQVGIEVRGRSAILRTNYRNTRQILETARTVVEDRPFDDLEDEPEPGERDVRVIREGAAPDFHGFDDVDDHDLSLAAAIEEVTSPEDVGPGDVAILVPTNRLVDEYASAIQRLGLSTQKLEQYDGRPNEHVKVGTYQRGKGLEFKYVFLPRLEPSTLGEEQRHGEDAETYEERLDLLRRRLYVAMTRARDGLWAGWVGEPAEILGGVE